MKPPSGDRTALYTRISRDQEGKKLGVERQRQDLEAFASSSGLAVVGHYEDNDIGASTSSTKPRPEYERMLSDVRAGKLDVILAYTASRLTRRPDEREELIRLSQRFGIRLQFKNSPTVDLSTADGRKMARLLGAIDTGETEGIAERVSRAAKQRAANGQMHGGRPAFGYEAVRQVVDNRYRIVRLDHHPEHARWVREAARRLLAGESLYGIARDWEAKDRATANGAVWRPRTIKRIVTSPAVAGLREYDGQLIPAKDWKPILKRADWDRLRALLGDDMHQSRPFPTGQTAPKHALSGLMRCKLCGNRLASMPAGKAGPASFYCSSFAGQRRKDGQVITRGTGCGKIRIAMAPVEQWVFDQLLDYLQSPELEAAMAATPTEDLAQRQTELRASIEADSERLDAIDDEHTDGLLDDARWRRQVQRLTTRIEANRNALAEVEARDAAPVAPDADAVMRGWKRHGSGSRADNAWRRSTLGMFIEQVTISPHPSGAAVNLTRRRGESDNELADRRAVHLASVLEARVKVRWKA
jgi:site-specific DNA recombinase